jgi:ABC-2 type transport system permease protein
MSGRRLCTLIRREIRATLRDPFTLAVLVSVPLVALLLFGTVLSTEARGLVVGIHDADRSVATRRLVAELEASGLFEVRPYGSRRRLDEALVAGEIDAALVLPPGAERAVLRAVEGGRPAEIRVHYDGVETVLAGNAEAFLGAIVSRLDLGRGAARELGSRPTPVVRAVSNPRLEGVPFMVAGTFGFVLSFLTTLITAVAIVNERTAGTFEQLRVTPATGLEILLGKILPLGAVFAFDVIAMALVAGGASGFGLPGAWRCSSASRRGTCSFRCPSG